VQELSQKNRELNKIILNILWTAKSYEEKIEKFQNESTKALKCLLEENTYLRKALESPPVPMIIKEQNDFFTKQIERISKHKKSPTSIFEETLCFKIKTEQDTSKELDFINQDTKIDHCQINLNTKKLALYKPRPNLYLFRNNKDKVA
jgi:hypothetical protein